MKIVKVVNNNTIVAVDESGKECILVGKGLGFGADLDATIQERKAEKIFQLKSKGVTRKLSNIIENIPLEQIKVCDEIINMAKKELTNPLQETIYLSLIDHISYAIERHQDGLDLKSTFIFDIKRFYPQEFEIGQKALDIIENRLSVRLPEDEAAFIAFHFISASANFKNYDVQDSLSFINEILSIVKYSFPIPFEENSISYNRFLTHLKFFSIRFFSEDSVAIDNKELAVLPTLQKEMPDEAACVEKISNFIKSTYQKDITQNEKLYLLIHLHSLLNR